MQILHLLIAMLFFAAPQRDLAPAGDNPMASWARLVGDEWRVTPESGTSMFHTWHWGPGHHSLRRMTDGVGASGEPWRELQVVYWHPGHNEVRLLGMSPVARGIWEGTVKLEKETLDATLNLYQTTGPRKLVLRWAFEGRDKFHETLLEDMGNAKLVLLVKLDHLRVPAPATPRPRDVAGATKPSEQLKPLEPLLRNAWVAEGNWTTGGAFSVDSRFEWIPLADAIYGRMLVPGKNGEGAHVLDAYFYYHTRTGRLRTLALSKLGVVYEGDVTVLDDGALQIDLKGYEGTKTVSYLARFDFEKDETLRHRIWSIDRDERRLVLDVRHQKLPLKKG